MGQCEEYFKGDELAVSVWQGKYAADGEITPDDMHRRMAKEFARIEKQYSDSSEPWEIRVVKTENLSRYGKDRKPLVESVIYDLFKDFKYIVPQGSIMYGLGRNDKYISLSNCFVIDSAKDSYGGIFKTEQEQIQLMKRRGGVGHDISNLRPEGTAVSNSAGTSTGVVSFMERFSNATREVAQAGRRGK
jgi:ribonucleoside-diphosphate reductase alpha chain